MYDALDSMVCVVDSREQDTPRLRARLRQIGGESDRRKLDFGDYSADFPLPTGEIFTLSDKVVIERKMNIDELCLCYTKDRERFEREFERAAAAGARIYLIIENASWENIYAGKYRSKMRETALVASILAYISRYDCIPIFCKPETTGKLIKDILYREGKKRLEELEVPSEWA